MPGNIFEYLDLVRERPAMCVQSLDDLESQIWGYLTALRNHNIVEPVPSMGRHFLYYVRQKTDWGVSRGWAYAITQHVDGLSKQLETFFTLADSYRQLTPKKVATAILSTNHNPTGKRRRTGFDGLMEKPCIVDVIQYAPDPLHFLRFHYDDRIEDDDLLFDAELKHSTTVDDGKRWLNDEFGFESNGWQDIAEHKKD
jgi:hypothetical protein